MCCFALSSRRSISATRDDNIDVSETREANTNASATNHILFRDLAAVYAIEDATTNPS